MGEPAIDECAAKGRVYQATGDGVCRLRLEGELRYTLAPSIIGCLDRLPDCSRVVVDLTATELVDSTVLGAIARLGNRVHERGGGRLTILSTRADVTTVLESMGFDSVFDIVDDEGVEIAGQPLPPQTSTNGDLLSAVLDAHRTLIDLSDGNRERFRELVLQLEAERERGL